MDAELERAKANAFIDGNIIGEPLQKFNDRPVWHHFLTGYSKIMGEFRMSEEYSDSFEIEKVDVTVDNASDEANEALTAGAMLAMRRIKIESKGLSGTVHNIEVEP